VGHRLGPAGKSRSPATAATRACRSLRQQASSRAAGLWLTALRARAACGRPGVGWFFSCSPVSGSLPVPTAAPAVALQRPEGPAAPAASNRVSRSSASQTLAGMGPCGQSTVSIRACPAVPVAGVPMRSCSRSAQGSRARPRISGERWSRPAPSARGGRSQARAESAGARGGRQGAVRMCSPVAGILGFL